MHKPPMCIFTKYIRTEETRGKCALKMFNQTLAILLFVVWTMNETQ